MSSLSIYHDCDVKTNRPKGVVGKLPRCQGKLKGLLKVQWEWLRAVNLNLARIPCKALCKRHKIKVQMGRFGRITPKSVLVTFRLAAETKVQWEHDHLLGSLRSHNRSVCGMHISQPLSLPFTSFGALFELVALYQMDLLGFLIHDAPSSL